MQTVKIDLYISDLLYSYDCVIVPNFGGFIANYAPAHIQAIQHKFAPPSKHISFNKNLKNNDGLLANHIAERRSIDYAEANSLIASFVNQSLEGLKKGDKIHIEKVGTLYLDPEQNIQFKAEESNDFLLESFGLGSFRALPIQREGATERIQKQIQEQIPLIREEVKEKRRVYWPAAALLIFLLISSFVLNLQFGWVPTPEVNYSMLSFDDTSIAPTYESKVLAYETEKFSFKKVNERSWPAGLSPYTLDEKATAISVEVPVSEEATKIDNTNVVLAENLNQLRFHVMGGCFSQFSNAQGLVNRLLGSGFDARLLGQYKNLHAVSYGSFATRSEAIELLAKVRNGDNPDAWLLVKSF